MNTTSPKYNARINTSTGARFVICPFIIMSAGKTCIDRKSQANHFPPVAEEGPHPLNLKLLVPGGALRSESLVGGQTFQKTNSGNFRSLQLYRKKFLIIQR